MDMSWSGMACWRACALDSRDGAGEIGMAHAKMFQPCRRNPIGRPDQEKTLIISGEDVCILGERSDQYSRSKAWKNVAGSRGLWRRVWLACRAGARTGGATASGQNATCHQVSRFGTQHGKKHFAKSTRLQSHHKIARRFIRSVAINFFFSFSTSPSLVPLLLLFLLTVFLFSPSILPVPLRLAHRGLCSLSPRSSVRCGCARFLTLRPPSPSSAETPRPVSLLQRSTTPASSSLHGTPVSRRHRHVRVLRSRYTGMAAGPRSRLGAFGGRAKVGRRRQDTPGFPSGQWRSEFFSLPTVAVPSRSRRRPNTAFSPFWSRGYSHLPSSLPFREFPGPPCRSSCHGLPHVAAVVVATFARFFNYD